MRNQALIWNTDTSLRVTSLTARLRGFAGIGERTGDLHVSDLWDGADPFPILAHQWALGGETLAFDAHVFGTHLAFEVEPLLDPQGAIAGVTGRAAEIADPGSSLAAAYPHAERAAGLGTWHEDLRTGTVAISEGLANLLGLPYETTQLSLRSFDHPADREQIARTLAEGENEFSYTCDHRILCQGGRVRSVRERLRTMFDEGGAPIARIGTVLDITDLKEREAELCELALRDGLTHLPNRHALEERLRVSLARCERSGQRCAVFFIDLDDFKSVNDVHGHAYGDRVLVAVADRLTRHVRASDTVARIGGDEFVVVIDDLYTEDAAADAARKILRSLDEPLAIDEGAFRVRASIGVATYPGSCTSAPALVAAADREMYAVKRNGGNGIKLATAWQAHSSPARPLFETRESA
ncbi:MAG TPA: sensor domain-containing diguanylate cyclase [Alphaproteobacteria bacterium]|nr:sensor domain-containing diguanylate cyclase [Alphaproteobacteria bacterium]